MSMFRTLVLASVVASASFVHAVELKPTTADKKYSNLVNDLGHKSFRIRKAAESKLLDLGLKARKALKAGLQKPDLEVRMRAHNILLRISQRDTEKKLSAFMQGDDKIGAKLPGWTKLKKIIGDEVDSRKLYVKMMRAESDLFDAFESDSPLVLSRYRRRLDTIRYSNLYRTGSAGIDSVAAVLVVGALSNIKLNSSQISNIYYLLISNKYRTYLQKKNAHSTRLRIIIEYWMVRNSAGFSSYYMLQMAMRLNLKNGGLKVARRALAKRRSTYSYTMLYAALVIGRFGNKKDDIPILEDQLNNTFVCYRSSRATIQVRDVCLAVLVELTKQKHRDYNFKNLRKSTQTLFYYTSIKFETPDDRDKAIAKWRKWSKENLKS